MRAPLIIGLLSVFSGCSKDWRSDCPEPHADAGLEACACVERRDPVNDCPRESFDARTTDSVDAGLDDNAAESPKAVDASVSDGTSAAPLDSASQAAVANDGAAAQSVDASQADSAALPDASKMLATWPCRMPGECTAWPVADVEPSSKVRPSYSFTGDVVVDATTGLIWQRNLPATYTDCSGTGARTCLWSEAKRYCEQLSLGGRDDWRLPTRAELRSIVEHGRWPLAIDNATFGIVNGNGVTADFFWSSSVQDPLPNAQPPYNELHFTVQFTFGGNIGVSNASGTFYVRCVRAGMTKSDRYVVDVANAEVTDLGTGLIWEQTYSRPMGWKAALAYCTTKGQGWRLPARKELASIWDPNSVPAIDARAFPGTPEDRFWSSSKDLDPKTADGYAWYIDFAGPYSPKQSDVETWWSIEELMRARCVR